MVLLAEKQEMDLPRSCGGSKSPGAAGFCCCRLLLGKEPVAVFAIFADCIWPAVLARFT